MRTLRPYVQISDVRAICPFVDQLGLTDDGYTPFLVNSRAWLDAAIVSATQRVNWVDYFGEVIVDSKVIRACSYRAAYEILASQITPQADNAYERMAAKYQRIAEGDLSALVVQFRGLGGNGLPRTINLGHRIRGWHG